MLRSQNLYLLELLDREQASAGWLLVYNEGGPAGPHKSTVHLIIDFTVVAYALGDSAAALRT